MAASNKEAVKAIYSQRAPNYDGNEKVSSHHVKLGQDYTDWIQPQKGDKILDLACGTGLVTIPLAQKVGSTGLVIGVDITREMLNIGRAKTHEHTNIELVEHDITSPSMQQVPCIRDILDQGGFDIITCCSALILLPDPADAIQFWTGMLKKGGRMIVDVTCEHRNLQFLLSDTMRDELGIKKHWERTWVKGPETLENAFTTAGLRLVRSWKTDSLIPITIYPGDEETSLRVFDEEVVKYDLYRGDVLTRARELWPRVWKSALNENDEFVDSHCLYVCVGEKL